MSKLIKYLIVDVKTGKWNWNKEIEHHSIAVPKMLNNLELRSDIILNKVADRISKAMKDSFHNRSSYDIKKEINEAKEENNLHIYMLNEFKRKVFQNLEGENKISPIMKLKKMDSPINRKGSVTISHMYERYDNEEILDRLNKFTEKLHETTEILDKTFQIWNNILNLYDFSDPKKMFQEIKNINKLLITLDDDEIYESFFSFDDATRGLIKKGVTIKVYLNDAYNKFYDLILRTFIKSANNYRKSEESQIVDKAFLRMKELKIKDYQILLDIKIMLEVETLPNPSLEICYKKVGEMHANINKKLFEISGLIYLKKYFSEKTVELIDKTIQEMRNIHDKISDKDELVNLIDDKKLIERNISELEIYNKIVKDLLLDTDESKTILYLNEKLHQINSYIASKYYVLNEKDLYRCLKIIGDESFKHFITTCMSLMFALRKELKHKEDVVDADDLVKVGIVTGKTTMITSYNKAVDVILASLGTFMGNTLHSLIKEMLQNLTDKQDLIDTYEITEIGLREFDQDSDSL